MLLLEKGLKGLSVRKENYFPTVLILIQVNEFLILMFTFATVLHTLLRKIVA